MLLVYTHVLWPQNYYKIMTLPKFSARNSIKCAIYTVSKQTAAAPLHGPAVARLRRCPAPPLPSRSVRRLAPPPRPAAVPPPPFPRRRPCVPCRLALARRQCAWRFSRQERCCGKRKAAAAVSAAFTPLFRRPRRSPRWPSLPSPPVRCVAALPQRPLLPAAALPAGTPPPPPPVRCVAALPQRPPSL